MEKHHGDQEKAGQKGSDGVQDGLRGPSDGKDVLSPREGTQRDIAGSDGGVRPDEGGSINLLPDDSHEDS